ncbi:acyl-CoA dehydrogenase family protein [Amycolatopsis anabasis]|uniref:acyl-CoA dehydrogenase family protein n=1 Tax=Amycolatopsis anabasis TaxID=1840409 RepID=UPI00131BB013|nr:acyl-CoA dehydrogenase family protein [Amycolatopsis anabasis]
MTIHTDYRADLSMLTGAFAQRAAEYDRTATFPARDFEDLFAAGLHAPTVPEEYGGMGIGPLQGETHALWMMTKELASADLSLARCWEGHANSLLLIDALGTEAQRSRWFDGVVRSGEKWVVWSGEPRAVKPGERRRFGTTIRRRGDGWVVNGSKVFATGATGADWAILLIDPAGPGGARHAGPDAEVLMLACRLDDPSISVDDSWWDPIGMRATASHLLRFDDTYIPDAQRIGQPGDYLSQGWQTAFVPHYAASFLGAAEAAHDYAAEYVLRQEKGGDPYVQHRIGAMALAVETGHLWLKHVAGLWDRGDKEKAGLAGTQAWYVIERAALETVHHCVRVCGARCLIRPSAVERLLRDLSFYVCHDNEDRLLATVGRAALGQPFDPAFHR